MRYEQFCALARAAEILGERWTLLIVRELLLGPKRFGDLAARLDGVSPTVLTARLNAMIETGLVRKALLPPPYNLQVYELTSVGLALKPAIREMIRWGGNFLFPKREGEAFEPEWAFLALEAIALRSPSPNHTIVLRLKHGAKEGSFVVSGGPSGTTLATGGAPGVPVIMCGFDTLLRIVSTDLPLDQAVECGLAKVEGSMRIARALPRLFDLAEKRGGKARVVD